jgi:hypothetical protein
MVLGEERPDTLASIDNLAEVLRLQGRYKQAEEMHQQALGLRETLLGKEHPDTLMRTNELAVVLRDQGKYEQAEETRIPVQILTPILSFNRGCKYDAKIISSSPEAQIRGSTRAIEVTIAAGRRSRKRRLFAWRPQCISGEMSSHQSLCACEKRTENSPLSTAPQTRAPRRFNLSSALPPKPSTILSLYF